MPIVAVNKSSVSSISDVNIANAMIEGLTSKRLQNNISIPFNRRIQGGPIVTGKLPGKIGVIYPPRPGGGFGPPEFIALQNPTDDRIIQALANFYGLTVEEFCKRNPDMCEYPIWGLGAVGVEQFNEGALLSLYSKWLLDSGNIRSNFYKLIFCNGNTPCDVWNDGILGGVNTEWLEQNHPDWLEGYEEMGDAYFLSATALGLLNAWHKFNQEEKDKVLNYILSVLTEMKTAWGLSEQQKAYIEMLKQLLQSESESIRNDNFPCFFRWLFYLFFTGGSLGGLRVVCVSL